MFGLPKKSRSSRKRRSSFHSRQRRRFRKPRLEQLEDRRMLHSGSPHDHPTTTKTFNFDIREDVAGDGLFDAEHWDGDPVAHGVVVHMTNIRKITWEPNTLPERLPDRYIPAGGSTTFDLDCVRFPEEDGFLTICDQIAFTVQPFTVDPTLIIDTRPRTPNKFDAVFIHPNNTWRLLARRNAVAEGQAFIDDNANGVREEEETETVMGWEGVDAEGNYLFTLPPTKDFQPELGIPTDSETLRPRFFVTTLHAPRNLESGDRYQQDVGVFEYAKASGTVFYDTNANGIRDAGESVAKGVTVFWDRDHDNQRDGSFSRCFPGVSSGEVCTLTDENGRFELPRGVYDNEIEAEDEIGGTILARTVRDSIRVDESGQVYTNLMIPVEQQANITGRIFTDINGNGVYDHSTDTRLPGADVVFDLNNDGDIDGIARADTEGIYAFYGVYPGHHRLIPAVTDLNHVIGPASHEYLISVPMDDTTGSYDFALSPDATLVFDSKIDAPADDGRDSEEVQALKRSIVGPIRLKAKDAPEDRRELLLNFVNKIIGQYASDGYINASLDTLQRLAQTIDLQTEIREDKGWWDDFFDLTLVDVDRLDSLAGAASDRLWDVIADPVYQTELAAENAWRIGSAITASLKQEYEALKIDLERDFWDIITETFDNTVADVGKTETWTKLASDMLGIELMQQGLTNPDVPVEQRIASFLFGYFQFADTIATAGAATAAMKNRAKLKLQSLFDDAFDGDVPKSVLDDLDVVVEATFQGKKRVADLGDGEIIPDEIIEQTGWTPPQRKDLADIAEEAGVIMRFRTTNPASARHIADGAAAKPVTLKSKTINEVDVHLGYDPDDVGLVGFKDPADLPNPAHTEACIKKIIELCDRIKERFVQRVEEYYELVDDFKASGQFVERDGVVFDVAQNKPIAGDIDPVSFQYPDGTFVTGDEYIDLLERLMASAAMVQHGGEVYLVSDIKRGLAEKLAQTGDPKYIPGSDYWNKAIEKAENLKKKLRQNHLDGKETTIEIGPDRIFKKRNIDNLPHVDFDGTVDGISPFPAIQSSTQPRTQQLIEGMGYELRSFGEGGYNRFLSTVEERMTAQIELHAKQLRREFPDVGINTTEYDAMSPSELFATVSTEPNGLNISLAADSPLGEGEGSAALTAAMIIDKLREAVGEAGLADFTVVENSDGSWKVTSKFARESAFDVNDDGSASPLDALIVINQLNRPGTPQFVVWPSREDLLKDTNVDGHISPIDALVIINFLNDRGLGSAAEGESVAAPRFPLPNAVDEVLADVRSSRSGNGEVQGPVMLPEVVPASWFEDLPRYQASTRTTGTMEVDSIMHDDSIDFAPLSSVIESTLLSIVL